MRFQGRLFVLFGCLLFECCFLLIWCLAIRIYEFGYWLLVTGLTVCT